MEQTICVFGDSIVWGAWDRENGGWVSRLRRYFETNDYDLMFLYNCGVSGDTTDNLLKRFNVECEARVPSIIIFNIGSNDSYYYGSKDKPGVSTEKFQNNLRELIDRAKKFCSKIIFVGLTPVDEFKTQPLPWDTDVYHDQANTVLYNEKIREVCEENNMPFIEMLDTVNIKDMEDGVHPNSNGHEKMFLKIKDYLINNKII